MKRLIAAVMMVVLGRLSEGRSQSGAKGYPEHTEEGVPHLRRTVLLCSETEHQRDCIKSFVSLCMTITEVTWPVCTEKDKRIRQSVILSRISHLRLLPNKLNMQIDRKNTSVANSGNPGWIQGRSRVTKGRPRVDPGWTQGGPRVDPG